MLFKNFNELTSEDFNNQVVTTWFVFGCNCNCEYCFNKDRVVNTESQTLTEKDLISYLTRNGRFLQGLVISGGEPTIFPDLPDVLRTIKESFPNLKLKLFTNGLNPDLLSQCLNYLDSVSMDVKGATPEDYDRVLGLESLPNSRKGLAMLNVVKSIRLLINNNAIEPVFRCVYLPEIHTNDSLKMIKDLIYPYPLDVASLIG